MSSASIGQLACRALDGEEGASFIQKQKTGIKQVLQLHNSLFIQKQKTGIKQLLQLHNSADSHALN